MFKRTAAFLHPTEIVRRGYRYCNHPGPFPIEEADLRRLFPGISAERGHYRIPPNFPFKTGELSPICLQLVLRLARYAQPETVLEIGTFSGKTAYALAHVLPTAAIITVDVAIDMMTGMEDHYGTDMAYLQTRERIGVVYRGTDEERRIVQVMADSGSHECAKQIDAVLNGRRIDFALIDGAHSYTAVKADFEELVLPRLADGGIVVFDDYDLLMTHLGVTHYLLQKAYEDSYLFYWVTHPSEKSTLVFFVNRKEFRERLAHGGKR